MVERMQEVTVPIGGHIEQARQLRLPVVSDPRRQSHRQRGRPGGRKSGSRVFGEMALIDDILRNADVVAVTP
jgi:hypothetical protein